MSNEKKDVKVETVLAESKEITVEQIEKAQTREEKKKLRRAAIENMGPLYLDEKFKKPGYRQRLVNVEPGNIQKRELEGYRPISGRFGQVGNGAVDTSHSVSSLLEVEVGRRASATAIWMEISEEDALILDEIRDEKAREQASMIYKSDIPDNVRIGNIKEE
jgi:hypothetical protein